jgi:hypothetical protein
MVITATRNSAKKACCTKCSVVLREKNKIESPIPIGNKNLVNKLYSLLALVESEVSILSGKGVGEVRGIIDLRYINRQKRAL